MIGSKLLQQRSLSPDGSGAIPIVYVKSPTYYPLALSQADRPGDPARPGDLVAVYAPEDQLLGYGLDNSRSEIVVGMLWHDQSLPDDPAWREKLEQSLRLRRGLLQNGRQYDVVILDPPSSSAPARNWQRERASISH